jgi:sarcosine oxidase subunit alpha
VPGPARGDESPRPVRIHFDGRTIEAAPGQSIGAALYAAGVRIFSRSFKYHRPRGLFCAAGACPNCLMNVDGCPNVRVCTEPARDGQVVRSQNAWPSLEHDALSIFDKLDRFLPVGFYYKRFYRPRFLWPMYEHVIRRIAGLGEVAAGGAAKDDHATHATEHIYPDVLVVGAGPAGLSAAIEATRAGARVLLVDRMPRTGGHLNYDKDPPTTAAVEESLRQLAAGDGRRVVCSVAGGPVEHGAADADLRIRLGVSVFGVYDGLEVGAVEAGRLLKIRPRTLVVATGEYERPLVFHNNDLPGVMLGRAAQRLLHLYRVPPGRDAVVVTDRERGYRLAADLQSNGVTIRAIVDLRGDLGQQSGAATSATDGDRLAGVPVFRSHTVLAAIGKRQVEAVSIARVGGDGTIDAASTREVACDLVCLSAGGVAAGELLYQAGCKIRHDAATGDFLPMQIPPGVFAAGEVAGTHDSRAAMLEGRLRGVEAAASLGLAGGPLQRAAAELQAELAAVRPAPHATHSKHCSSLMPSASAKHKKRFVCLCEDVTEKDLCDAVTEGFDNIETLKRYSTVSMGPCQGKVCSLASIEVCARQTGRAVADVGATTSRPPVEPVSLGVLAGSHHAPIRRTPMHARHDALGCTWTDAGEWKRPEVYSSIEAEYRAVRERVGVIDVGTLGKIDLIGPDAVALLDRVYVNQWRSLKVGRTRYGVMCTEEGIVFDDGTCGRLADQYYFMTTTTSNIEAVFQSLLLWKTILGLNVEVINVTGGYAAVNVAGPKAREVMAALTSADVSAAALPYMAIRAISVAGVPCRVLRVGFVGECGFEIHCPAEFGAHLWDAVIDAGRPHGIAPFGVEAQRTLRLDKQHIIVGQDTDALSNPFDAGLGAMVKLDKPDFVGKAGLQRAAREPGPQQLVGFVIDGAVIPDEGCQVVERGRPVGRVTSCRFSFARRGPIGLAWVPRELAEHDRVFSIRTNGSLVTARVHREPFYDPDGLKLRS